MGDVENWARTIESDLHIISKSLELVVAQKLQEQDTPASASSASPSTSSPIPTSTPNPAQNLTSAPTSTPATPTAASPFTNPSEEKQPAKP